MPKSVTPNSSSEFSIIVLLSGKGSNLQAILEHIEKHKLNIRISAVISNKVDALGLVIAQNNNIQNIFIDPAQYIDRTDFDAALLRKIESYQSDLIVLAGYMRILSDSFVEHFVHKLINIHPSLLPKFKGMHTHRRVLESKEKLHGCSVHFVNPELDSGPVIAQAKCTVDEQDTEKSLKEKVHQLEHQLYPLVIEWIANKRISLENRTLKIQPKIQTHELPSLEVI